MKTKKIVLILSAILLALLVSEYVWFRKGGMQTKKSEAQEAKTKKPEARETIFDRVVSIPKKLVFDVPQLPPLCDEIMGLNKGLAIVENGGRIYYEEEGHGIPLVLINGGPGCTHQGFHPYFSQLRDYAHLIYYDQRGTGRSSRDATGKTYTIKQAVEDLEGLRKSLGINRWAVLGWSYGGLLAQCYALMNPDRVMGLILVATQFGLSEPVTKPEWQRSFFSQAEWDALENIQKKSGPSGIFQTAAQVAYNRDLAGGWKYNFYHKPTSDDLFRKALYGYNSTPDFEEHIRAEIYKIDLRGKFADFEIPTLIIEAKWDLLLGTTDRIEIMRKNHPHATVAVFEKSGHTVFADEPEKFFSLVRDFLKKTSKTTITYRPGKQLTWPAYCDQAPFARYQKE